LTPTNIGLSFSKIPSFFLELKLIYDSMAINIVAKVLDNLDYVAEDFEKRGIY